MKNNTSGLILIIAILMGLLNSSPLTGQVDSTYRFYFYDQRYSLFEALETKPGQIIMLGNSITNGGNWSELLGNNRVINRGISGDNTFGVLNRLDEIVSSQPQKIFILIGINDLSRETPVDVILNNYKRIVKRIQKDSPGTKIYVQSLFPTNNEFDHFPRAQNKDDEIRAVNNGIEEIAGEYGLTFIDLYPHFLDEEGKLSKDYTNDGLHLMGEGYLKWAEILMEFIEE
ncbi:MAG: SGNH/GDSL hydrolase family protein [Bacteroidales bacterium]